LPDDANAHKGTNKTAPAARMPICLQLGLDFVNFCDKLDSRSAWQHLVSTVFPFDANRYRLDLVLPIFPVVFVSTNCRL
jgi:hypothetical protein